MTRRSPTRKPGALAAAGPVVSAVSVQSGAGFAATLIPLVGPVGVVGLRQVFSALVLLPSLVRGLRGIAWHQLRPALLLGLTLVVMNVSIYAALERIDLGLAVTLEFLGPLAVALFATRRALDLLWGLAAGVGVLLLTGTVGDIDLIGVLLALIAGAAWAAYILVGAQIGARLPGAQGTAIASAFASVFTLPFLIVALVHLDPSDLPLVLGVGVAVGVLSSALPYSVDVAVMRLIPRRLFSVLQSVHPAAAALAGLIILGQQLALLQVLGLVIVSLANAAAVLSSARREAISRRAEKALVP